MSGYYPAGAEDDPNAPYNEVEQPSIKIRAIVSVSISKEIEVAVDDYETEVDEDENGVNVSYDIINCDTSNIAEEELKEISNLGWSIDDVETENIEVV